jgi:site-specific DNA recombinase
MQGLEGVDLSTTPYDGCGKCLVAMIRLSSLTETTDSPGKQAQHCREEAVANGGHIIGWAVDLDVSGATNPFDRKGIGPWLKDAKGAYDGIVASAVDRIGRELVDVLVVGRFLRDAGKLIITRGHHGPWNLYDQVDEQTFQIQAMGAQMELRATQRRTSDTAENMRRIGRKYGKLSHGYRYVRVGEGRKIDHIAVDQVILDYLGPVGDRILADETGLITQFTEAKRLTREGVLAPDDYRRVLRGLAPKGTPWSGTSLRGILISPATQGYLMYKGKPVLDVSDDPAKRGRPIRVAPPMWDYAKHVALNEKLARTPRKKPRAPKTDHLLIGISTCGRCGNRLYAGSPWKRTSGEKLIPYECRAREKMLKGGERCKPSPTIVMSELDDMAEAEFLAICGGIPLFEQVFDPGSDSAARLAEVVAERNRLREDRNAGLYDSDEDAGWYRREYMRLTNTIQELKTVPQRPAGTYWRPTGVTVADQWYAAKSNYERRELMAAYDFHVELFDADAARRVVFHFLDADAAWDARQESWEEHLRLIDAEEDYRARAEADQDAAEIIEEDEAQSRVPQSQVLVRLASGSIPDHLRDTFAEMCADDETDEDADDEAGEPVTLSEVNQGIDALYYA